LVATSSESENAVCYGSGVLKFTVSKTESRRVRATAKQIGGARSDLTHSLEDRCELHEESTRRLDVRCELSPLPNGHLARIFKALARRVKELFVHILRWIQTLFTH
jgi:hypothetical protein